MYITLKLEKSVTSIPELSRAIDAFEAIDEIYRLIKAENEVNPRAKIDFRRKPFKDIKGSELDKFNVTSPPEITVSADNLWIAAIIFILKDYSNTKQNIIEFKNDAGYLAKLIAEIGEDQFMKVSISAQLFSERLDKIGSENKKWLYKKLETAQRILHRDNIKSINTHDE